MREVLYSFIISYPQIAYYSFEFFLVCINQQLHFTEKRNKEWSTDVYQ